jgi:acyl-CoA thioesterase I
LGGDVARQVILSSVLALGLVGTIASAADDTAPLDGRTPCQLPPALVALGGPLPHATAEIRHHHALKVVALGSSSTYGTGASEAAATYPSRLEVELGQLFPGVHFKVINKGVPGEVAADMVGRLERDAIAPAPDLVVWQTGTNDALRDLPVDEFARLTVEGVGRLHDAGIDVVLMEPQYSPKLVRQPHYADYVEALRTIGHTTGAPVVRRFDIMKAWMASGQFIDATLLQTDALHMRDASYACLGWVVAEAIAGAVNEAVQSPARLTAGAVPAK